MTTELCVTVDVEDWYEGMAVLGHSLPVPQHASTGLESLTETLDRVRPAARITLFVVSNYAPRVRSQLVELIARGHEIASHGPDHRRLPEGAVAIANWLRRGREELEDLLGVSVGGFGRLGSTFPAA